MTWRRRRPTPIAGSTRSISRKASIGATSAGARLRARPDGARPSADRAAFYRDEASDLALAAFLAQRY
ncbi:hypothetical protein SPHINGO391_350030 [Sphingomonas aurantiaca]|uniref:Uncharacterized protein n=1 Tax=Sphingomonas aurantiaca TaxID=185949 RepID=A0A5E7Y0H1_9SPHN|nr:hypothetical protein SPHINGO391_350030 [Sphingomonas aurantiaca]